MLKAMMITVGTGETISHGICCSIKQQNPDYVIFVLTKESESKIFPHILENEVMMKWGKNYEKVVLSNENDFQEIQTKCIETIENILKKGYNPKDIVIDYTFGTKAMSAAIVIAGIKKSVGTLIYVSGERDENGRVISGTEKPIPIEPNTIYADLLFERAVDLFNTCQFSSCEEIIKQIKGMIGNHPKYHDKLILLMQLSQAYSSWDRFDLKGAFEILDKLIDSTLLSDWGIKNKVEDNKQILYKEKNENFCIERIVDLFENARRRGKIDKKYDDAIARLYRLLEYISQYLIFKRGLYPKDEKENVQTNNIILDGLPTSLQKKYSDSKYKNENGKIQLGLVRNYELLADLEDEIGESFIEEYKKKDGLLKKITGCRNNSILAHGFGPVGEECFRDFLSICENYAKKLFPDDFDRIKKQCEFPTLKV